MYEQSRDGRLQVRKVYLQVNFESVMSENHCFETNLNTRRDFTGNHNKISVKMSILHATTDADELKVILLSSPPPLGFSLQVILLKRFVIESGSSIFTLKIKKLKKMKSTKGIDGR